MKPLFLFLLFGSLMTFNSCQNSPVTDAGNSTEATAKTIGQSGVQDDVSMPNVVKVAVASKDHTTLVTAVKAAELVDALSNAGPFTVFAPTNDAFSQLPAGTVEGLLKPEKKTDLQNILQYHVWLGVLNQDAMQDGQVLNMVNGDNVTLHGKDGKFMIGDANIVATVHASNGIVYVIDKVLLPPPAAN
ncbi:MAG: fasciclin domain-containing protein [Chitinophagales bacterium]